VLPLVSALSSAHNINPLQPNLLFPRMHSSVRVHGLQHTWSADMAAGCLAVLLSWVCGVAPADAACVSRWFGWCGVQPSQGCMHCIGTAPKTQHPHMGSNTRLRQSVHVMRRV
jgi:hypothetical protein